MPGALLFFFLQLLAGCTPPVQPSPCLSDVPDAFESVRTEASAESIADGALFTGDDALRYAFSLENSWGIDNHFQGIARTGDWLFVSGGDRTREQADVFVARLEDGSWRFEGVVDLDEGTEWHAGGLDIADGMLAVPTENLRGLLGPRSASIRIFDVSDPLEATMLSRVERAEDATTAHAAGLTRFGDGWLLASWDDRGLDWYRSVGSDIAEGFESLPFARVETEQVSLDIEQVGTEGVVGQAVTLVQQCDGAVYAVLTDNTSDLPVDGGTDFADLYRVDIAGDSVAMSLVSSRVSVCPLDQGCNFRAAAGAWVSADAQLWLHSTATFRDHEALSTPLGVFEPR